MSQHDGNHDDEHEREFFARLEHEMTTESPAPDATGQAAVGVDSNVVDLDKARTSRESGSDEQSATESGRPEEGQAVDGPEPVGPGFLEQIRSAKRRPVIPEWAKSKPEFVTAAGWVVGHVGHTVAYHGVRLPWYSLQLAAQAPKGAAKLVSGRMRWAADVEGEPLRLAAARREDAGEYLKLTRQRDRRVRWRSLVMLAAFPFGVLTALALFVLAPAWMAAMSGGVVTMVMGWLGGSADTPIATRAVIKTEVQKLSSDTVVQAMASIGISQISSAVAKGKDGIKFVGPIVREGPGWRADIDLPLGVTPADVAERRGRLASALRRPLGCVWPEADPNEHEGRLILWVGDRDLSKAGFVTWQLAQARRHDVFKRVPFGIDPRGRDQSVPMIQHNVLIGSLPGQGKTASVRVLACGAALDPSVELWLHENKGTGDLDALERVSHRFVSGIDDASIKYAADSLALLRDEVMRRAAALKKLPRDLCPDKRVTREIADKRSLKLWPLLAVFDECQNLFAHSTYGKQAGEDAEFIIKLGRALGVILVLATQRPDKDSLPTGISGNVSIRFALRVAGQVENDMILGTSAYKNGVRATQFRPEIDAGNGYLAGATALPVVVRTAYLDDPTTEVIAHRALALRKAEGTLSGAALGEDPVATGPSYDLLADVVSVVPTGEERVWNERIATRLVELRPEVYGGWKGENVTSALKPYGIKTTGVAGNTNEGTRTTRRGIVRADLMKAITDRDERGKAA